MYRSFHTRQSGITLIEVLIAISIITAMLVAVGLSVTAYVDARADLLDDMKAVYLAEEGYEVLRALRDEDWNTLDTLSLDTTYYFDLATTTLAVGGTPEVIDGSFTRSFALREVYRDSDDDITASTTTGATVDTEILEVEVTVVGPTGTTSMKSLLSNINAI